MMISNIVLKVEGMSCNHCLQTIESALTELGVKGKVNLVEQTVNIDYEDSNISISQIKTTIEEKGYEIVT